MQDPRRGRCRHERCWLPPQQRGLAARGLSVAERTVATGHPRQNHGLHEACRHNLEDWRRRGPQPPAVGAATCSGSAAAPVARCGDRDGDGAPRLVCAHLSCRPAKRRSGGDAAHVGAAAEADAFVCSRAQPDVFGAARMLVVTGSWRKAEWNGRLPMTDHPRFERLQGSAETMHRRYHGGNLVAVILWLADLWMAWRSVGRGRFRSAAHNPDNAQLNVRRARLRMLLTALLMSATVVGIALRAGAADARAGKGLLLPQQHAKAVACPI